MILERVKKKKKSQQLFNHHTCYVSGGSALPQS